MDKFKATLFIFICLTMLLCSSCIYATDVNETTADTDDLQTVDETVTDTPALKANDEMGSFDELDNIIQNLKPGDTYNIDKNYRFDDAGTTGRCISIGTDNITINGNGYYLDGNNKSVTFKITGNNINILNLVIYNCQGYGEKITITIDGNPSIGYSTTMSPVYWKGANGTMSNCYLIENTAINGGALTWTGENGIINNTFFMNNTANGAGGAIYLNGNNATIANTIFINSTSKLLNEAIYLDRKQSSFNLDNIECDHLFCINGSNIGVDSDNLRKSYMTQFGGEAIDIIPIIYTSLFGMNTLDENTYYYGKFSAETHTFTLILIKTFEKYGITYENEYVIPANSMDEIFAGLVSNFYSINTKVIKTVRVNTVNDYEAVCHSDINNDILNTAVMDIIKNDRNGIANYKDLTYILNVNYRKNAIFISNEQGDGNMGYDMIMINGNGATVRAMTKEGGEYHWIVNTMNKTFAVSNLTIEGFSNAIRNLNGTCIFTNVIFNNNGMDDSYGGAITNACIMSCINCTFISNHGKDGGAIFSQGFLILENATFENNYVSHFGSDVLNVDQGVVVYNGPGNPITNVESISPFETAIDIITGFIAFAAITGMAMFLSFVAAGPAGIAFGLAVGAVVGIGIGLIMARGISSEQYNLYFHSDEEIIEFTSDMTSMAMETVIAATEFLDDMKVHDAKIPNFKMDDDNELCVYIDGDYYKVGSEAMYINGKWVKKIDTVEIDGKCYPKENSEYLKNNEYSEKRINLGLKVEFENLDIFKTLNLVN